MKTPNGSKKTSTIELRVSPELKDAIGRFSARRGESVSETIRELLSRDLVEEGVQPTKGIKMMKTLVRTRLGRGGLMLASVCALAVAYSFAAQAPARASVGAEARVTFAELDINGDAVITPEEYASRIAEEQADTAEDEEDLLALLSACEGTFIAEEITEERAELARAPSELAAERVAYLDSDRDGNVTYEELEALIIAERAQEFLDFDEDGNGFVTLSEIELRFAPAKVEEEKANLAEEGVTEACITALIGTDDPDDELDEDVRLLLAEFDADRDGRVSLIEFLER